MWRLEIVERIGDDVGPSWLNITLFPVQQKALEPKLLIYNRQYYALQQVVG